MNIFIVQIDSDENVDGLRAFYNKEDACKHLRTEFDKYKGSCTDEEFLKKCYTDCFIKPDEIYVSGACLALPDWYFNGYIKETIVQWLVVN